MVLGCLRGLTGTITAAARRDPAGKRDLPSPAPTSQRGQVKGGSAMANKASLKVRRMALTANFALQPGSLTPALSPKFESLLRRRPVDPSLKILCVGHDVTLLATRCAVLMSCGYRAVFAAPSDFKARLQENHFELVILSLLLSDSEKSRVRAAVPPDTRILSLDCLVLPGELAALVDEVMHRPVSSGRFF
jgi:hypothetical protein